MYNLTRNTWLFYILLQFCLIYSSAYLLNVTECGSTKGCWMMPPGCESYSKDSDTSCDSIVTWMPWDDNSVVLEIESKISDIPEPSVGKYVSMAFSYDDKMVSKLGNSFSDYEQAASRIKENLFLKTGKILFLNAFQNRMDNRLFTYRSTMKPKILGYIKAVRAMKPSPDIAVEENFKLFDLTKNNRFTLLFARGSTKPGESYDLGIHHMLDGPLFPWVSSEDMTPTEIKIIKSMKHYDIPRSIQYILVKVHGVTTLFAWWFFGAIGLILARFYKPAWSNKKFFGTAVWFQLHRACMVILLVLQSLGFIVIFVQAGDFKVCSYVCDSTDYALKIHTILGVTCMAAALINPVAALLRPSPTDPNRPYFNWAHWFIGTGSWIIATVTIFLSTELGKNGLKKNFKFAPTALMAIYIVSFILTTIALEMMTAYRLSIFSKTKSEIPLLAMSRQKVNAEQVVNLNDDVKRKLDTRQLLILIAFVTFSFCLCTALSVLIILNRLL